jgi:7-cyano-7-deazaguanine synthase
MSKGYVISLSGGLDSSVMAYHLAAQGHNIKAITVNYGQRHAREIEAARWIARSLSIEHQVLYLADPLRGILGECSSLLLDGPAIPEGHYAHESMKSTIIPNRNMLLISLAVAYSISNGLGGVAYAAHSGDHAIYPDCRPEFARAMDAAVSLCDWSEQVLLRPFINLTKADIVVLGAELKVPFERTWSCYKGGSTHCGKCGTCVERREAFELAGVKDPTTYE